MKSFLTIVNKNRFRLGWDLKTHAIFSHHRKCPLPPRQKIERKKGECKSSKNEPKLSVSGPVCVSDCTHLSRVEPDRRLEGNSSQSWVENPNMIYCISKSINFHKHLPQSPFTGQLF
jgi:hypothetical protein